MRLINNSYLDTFGVYYASFLKFQIAGWIPVDKLLHIVVGYAIMYTLIRKFQVRFMWSFFVVLVISLIKETLDQGFGDNTYLESSLDLVASISLPTLMIFVKRLKTGRY